MVDRKAQNFIPANDGSYLITGEGRTRRRSRQIRPEGCRTGGDALHKRDGCHSPKWCANSPAHAAEYRTIRWVGLAPEPSRAGKCVARPLCTGSTMDHRRELLDLFRQSAGDMLDELVRERTDQGRLRFRRHRRQLRPANAPGTAYVLLHHRLRRSERSQRRLGTCHRRHGRHHPGDGERLARKRRRNRLGRRRHRSDRRKGQGSRRRSNRRRARNWRAGAVMSNLDPKLLFTRRLPARRLPAEFPRADGELPLWLGHLPDKRGAVGTAALHLHCPSAGDHLTAGIIMARPRLHGPRLSGCARAGWFKGADRGDADPLDVDDSLAPPGHHVASLFCQHVAPNCRTAAPGTMCEGGR